MLDYKMQLIGSIERFLISKGIDSSLISDEIVLIFNDYTVTKNCTDLVVYEDENSKHLKKYCACLYVDCKSENTIYQYKRILIRFAEFTNKLYTEITPYDIRCFIAYEKSRGIKNTTLENDRAVLSAFFTWLTLEEVIEKNPCDNINKIKCRQEIKQPFSNIDLDALRGACETNRERALIEFLITSGVRINELITMNVDDIDFKNLSVHVRNGKSDKERVVYISDVTSIYLSEYLKERKDNNTALFCNKNHERMRDDGVRYILNKIGKRAGVDNVHPHRFRRTLATTLSARGMSIQEVQRILGHSNLNTTMRYVILNDSAVHSSYNKFIA